MSVAGTWKLAVQTQKNEQRATLTVAEADGVLTGTMVHEAGYSGEIYEGAVAGNDVSWKIDIAWYTLAFSGDIDGNEMTGSVDTDWGTFEFTGRRTA
jgi:hypothetical protein